MIVVHWLARKLGTLVCDDHTAVYCSTAYRLPMQVTLQTDCLEL